MVIVGNKIDLKANEKVKEYEGEKFALNNKAIFHLTSAANGDGINELFEKIGKIIWIELDK